MNNNSIFALMDILFAGCGVYIIYLYVEMKRTGKIRESMLMPKGLDVRKCTDVAGYIDYMGIKQIVFGICAVLTGGTGLLQDYFQKIIPAVYLVMMVLFFVSAVWYTVCFKKAEKMYW